LTVGDGFRVGFGMFLFQIVALAIIIIILGFLGVIAHAGV
jgi:hypothetical protein